MFNKQIMKLTLLLIGIACAFSSCETEKTEQLTGELYFPWLKMGNYYGQPDSVFQYYIEMRDSLGFDQLKKDDLDAAEYMMMLEENDLLLQPFIYLHIQGDQNALVFMDSSKYEIFKTFDYNDLISKSEKIAIKVTVKKLRPLVYDAREFHRMDRVEGETLPKQTKFRIENYQ